MLFVSKIPVEFIDSFSATVLKALGAIKLVLLIGIWLFTVLTENGLIVIVELVGFKLDMDTGFLLTTGVRCTFLIGLTGLLCNGALVVVVEFLLFTVDNAESLSSEYPSIKSSSTIVSGFTSFSM